MKNDPPGWGLGCSITIDGPAIEKLEHVRGVLEKALTFTSLARGLGRDEQLRGQSIALLDVGTAFLAQAVCEFDAALASIRSAKSHSP